MEALMEKNRSCSEAKEEDVQSLKPSGLTRMARSCTSRQTYWYLIYDRCSALMRFRRSFGVGFDATRKGYAKLLDGVLVEYCLSMEEAGIVLDKRPIVAAYLELRYLGH
jgi:hypothetical protein